MSYLTNNKIIFHIDFDSYFVSAHRALNPELINKPVAVGRKLKRSIASSISYELKQLGVKAGWPNFKIFQLEPKTIIVEPNFELYVNLSTKIFSYLSHKYTKLIEIYSIDECWLDVTHIVNNGDPLILARKIQNEIKNKFKIPISIGISYNKFLAKMATNLGKPFGLKHLTKNNFKDHIWPLEIKEFFGIGKNSWPKLNDLNIYTIGDLAQIDPYNLEFYDIFKSRSQNIVNEANGLGDDNVVVEKNKVKSIGTDLTFMSNDLEEREELIDILKVLVKKITTKAQNRNLVGNVVYINLRDSDKNWKGQQKKIKEYTNDNSEILETAIRLFDSSWNGKPLRGIGVKLNNVLPIEEVGRQLKLFDNRAKRKEISNNTKEQKIKNIIRNLNRESHFDFLTTAETLLNKDEFAKVQVKFVSEEVKIKDKQGEK